MFMTNLSSVIKLDDGFFWFRAKPTLPLTVIEVTGNVFTFIGGPTCIRTNGQKMSEMYGGRWREAQVSPIITPKIEG